MHTHFDSFASGENLNMYDAIKKHFTEWKLTDSDTWTFCELMRTFYILKETAEVLGRGGAHYTKNPCAEIIKSESETTRINSEVLPAIFDAIHALFIDGAKRKQDEEKQKIEKAKERARETITKARKEIALCEKTIKELEKESV